jgi:1A family penicillin-binding protein
MPQRKYFRKILWPEKPSRFGLFLRISFLFFFILLLGGVFVFVIIAKDLPRPEKFTEHQVFQSTKIYDRTGKVLLYELYGEEKRTIVPLSLVPESLINAILAAEDSNFYKHMGVDLKAIVRAILVDLRIGSPLQGASTISQQLIRSSFLTTEKTTVRKTKEIILTLELERRYPKDQILEWYLNQIPFGSNAYGVEAASQTYFQKSVSEISLAEAATLTALIKAPSQLSPYGDNLDKLLARKDYVLERMADLKSITKEEAKESKKEEIKFSQIRQPIKAPHFVMFVKGQLEEKYGEEFLKTAGLKVYTSLDWDLQETAEEIISRNAEANQGYRAFNAALVAMDPRTGQILAMVGSKDFFGESSPRDCIPGDTCLFDPYPNVSLLGRQPGSAFKPFVYATAFKKGFDDKTIVVDEETNFGLWGGESYIPRNYDGRFRGPVTLREALAQSLNVPSVKVLNSLAGLEDSIQTAKDLGITTLTQPASFYGLSLVLGGGEVRLLDMVSAYSVFATDGLRTPPVSLLKIDDDSGNVIEESSFTPKRVLEAEVARLINNILSDNQARAPIFGSNSPLYFKDYEVAAKTGTTDSYRDGWAIGYTPSIAVGVWVGNNDNSPMSKEPGVVVAGPIWHSFLEKALLLFPKETFIKPAEKED